MNDDFGGQGLTMPRVPDWLTPPERNQLLLQTLDQRGAVPQGERSDQPQDDRGELHPALYLGQQREISVDKALQMPRSCHRPQPDADDAEPCEYLNDENEQTT